jgi:WD40 repeat protein
VLRGHTLWGNGVSTVSSAALSKDGRRAVTGGIDGTVRVWNIPSDLLRGRDLMAKACSQTLADGPNSQNVINLSVLTSAEREAAPAIDPSADYRIEGDVSKPVSIWRRLAHSLGIGGR